MKKQSSGKIQTKITIDFLKKNIKVYLLFNTQSKNNHSFKQSQCAMLNVQKKEKQLTIIDKAFVISDDYNSVIIDCITYKIPIFFNRSSMRLNDVKTWEMIFYQIFYADIHKVLNKYKLF